MLGWRCGMMIISSTRTGGRSSEDGDDEDADGDDIDEAGRHLTLILSMPAFPSKHPHQDNLCVCVRACVCGCLAVVVDRSLH